MSRKFLKDACYSVRKILNPVKDLSFATKSDYIKGISNSISLLHESGIQISNITHLKGTHINLLIDKWKERGLTTGTIKNKLSQIRFILSKIGKENMIPNKNLALGVENRETIQNINRAINSIDVNRFKDPHLKVSIELQQVFGLRREESMKIIPSIADRGDHIELQSSWTKGGIGRSIPIVNEEQRALLDKAKVLVKKGESLIPQHKSYREQRDTYTSEVRLAEYNNLHGLRHAYAQKRYQELTAEYNKGKGWGCPKMGGPRALNKYQKVIDQNARLRISNELGHSRVEITRVYLG